MSRTSDSGDPELMAVQVIPHRIAGGMQRVAELLDTALPGFGVRSSVVTLNELTGQVSSGGARRTPRAVISAWLTLRRQWRGGRSAGSARVLPALGDASGSRGTDAVISHTVFGAALAATAARAAAVPCRMLVVHINREGLGAPKTILLWLLAQTRMLTHIVYCGQSVAETFGGLRGRIRTIGRPVQNGIQLPDRGGVEYQRVPGTPVPGSPAILMVAARLVPEKNLALAVEAVARCVEPVVLRIYGEGSEKSALEALAALHAAPVEFHGSVDRAKLQQAYSRATLFLLPSIAEGLPLVLVEAAAAGVPVIAADRRFSREVLGEGGFYPATDTPEQWARAIDTLCADPNAREGLRADAAQRIESFSVERMAREYAEIIRGAHCQTRTQSTRIG